MHVDFDPLSVDWSHFTGPAQRLDSAMMAMGMSGGGSAMGGGGGGGAGASYPVFTGLPYQRGAGGIGSMFRSFLRFLVPIGRQAGAAIGRQGLESGSRMLSQVLEGRNVKEAMVDEGRAGLKNLLEKAADNLSRQRGGAGGNFDFKRYRKQMVNNNNNNNNDSCCSTTTTTATKRGQKSGNRNHNQPTLGGNDKSIKRHLRKRKPLQSTVGPLSVSKPGASNNINSSSSKRLRFDTLGTY
ncbi:hypothetical protein niasHT_028303 [Heterodera trifolii]|uniref:Uncharacterized protein n=1 Tax=Heterodera trifolii TaxID=157864 RepID=A0ABD2JVQ4_9BILA